MVVFISHPFSEDPQRNQRLVTRIARSLALQGHVPLGPQIYLPTFLDEAAERELALKLCFKLLALADVMWVYGEPPSEGMRLEVAEAQRLGIPVVRKALP